MLKKENGFTLIEMLVVMLIITVLLLLVIPNISTQTKKIDEKGCDALVAVVQAQAEAYYFEKKKYPKTIEELKGADYITKDQETCNENTVLKITDGKVSTENNDI